MGIGTEIELDASAAVALLRGQDSSWRYDDVIEMFSHLRQKAKRLVEVLTCQDTDVIVKYRSGSVMRDRPPGPATSTAARGTPVQLPRTPVAHTAGPSAYQQPACLPSMDLLRRSQLQAMLGLPQH